nr:glycosyltransferase N-terminal domain-containing protein [Halanaerobacter jeridensis]
MKERFGWLPEVIQATFQDQPTVWIHGASVGEAGAASPLVTELRREFPEHKFLFSTMTATGQEMAAKIIDEADEFIYFPLDLPQVVKRVFYQINPELIVIMETELWPNFIKQAHRQGAKVMIASGRISDDSIKHYRYLGPVLDDLLSKVDYFSMQSELDKERIIELGAPEDKVENNGNTKFDQDYGTTSQAAKDKLYQEYKLDPQQPIVVLGSTHDNEEEQLLSLYTELKEKWPDLVLIVAPRYVERADELQELYQEQGIETIKRSEIDSRDPEQESVIIVDTIGELAQLYGLADLVFVGGSLIERGGHNVLEPAAQGKLVFFGPHMFNFKDSTALLFDHEVGIQVDDAEELTAEMNYYLNNREELQSKNEAAVAMIEKNQGAAQENAALAGSLIKEQHILCVRLSAIGDMIHALPIASALRKAYPQAEISWIVQSLAYDLVEDNPNLDNVILLPKEEWRADFKDAKWETLKHGKEFFDDLKEEYDFDVALDVHGLFKSGLTTYLSGAQRRIGPANGREGSTLFYNQQVTMPDEEVHQIERNLHLAQALGAEVEEVEFDIELPEAVQEEVSELLEDLEIEEREKLIAINPFTTWEAKNWLEERYAKLADRLITDLDCTVLFTGGPGDKSGVSEIIEMMDEEAYNLAGETNLKELAELYTRVDMFVGGDTGPMHLAVAQGTQSIVLMGPTNPQTHGPYGEQHIVIQPDIECKNCWERECPRENHLCMERITVRQVYQIIKKQQ